MKTHNNKLIAAIALCITLTGIRAHASVLKTIYNRMYEKYLDRNPSKETLSVYMQIDRIRLLHLEILTYNHYDQAIIYYTFTYDVDDHS